MIDYRYETFLALCEIKNYTKTALKLHMTQPAVTQHIKYLEKLYGCKLFSYRSKELELTDDGRLLYEYTKRIAADAERIKELLGKSSSRKISFGATLTIGEYIMPDILSKVMPLYKGVHFNMYVENTDALFKKLMGGEISFALVEGYFDKSQYSHTLFKEDPFIAVCSPLSEFAEGSYRIADLLKSKLILRESGSGSRAILQNILFGKNYSVNSFADWIEIGNIRAIKRLVEQNAGISFMYKTAAKEEIENGSLKEIDVSDFNGSREFNFVFLKDSIHRDEYLKWAEIFKQIAFSDEKQR